MERVEDFAYMADNAHTWFHCHKTGDCDEDSGDLVPNGESLECAGLLSMKVNDEILQPIAGFTPSTKVFDGSYDMIECYENDDTPRLDED